VIGAKKMESALKYTVVTRYYYRVSAANESLCHHCSRFTSQTP